MSAYASRAEQILWEARDRTREARWHLEATKETLAEVGEALGMGPDWARAWLNYVPDMYVHTAPFWKSGANYKRGFGGYAIAGSRVVTPRVKE